MVWLLAGGVAAVVGSVAYMAGVAVGRRRGAAHVWAGVQAADLQRRARAQQGMRGRCDSYQAEVKRWCALHGERLH